MATKPASRGIKLFGTDVPDGKKRTLTAGPISAVLDNGALRYIRFNGAEVLRGIAFLVRDKNWGTYAPAITGLKVRQGKDSFMVSYDAVCQDADQGIRYAAKIEASAQGVVRFSAHATPLTDFLTNRTGFVVLHPLVGVVGEPVEIVHTDGKTRKSRFPKFISPGQPVFEIRSLKHTVTPGVTATVLMEGNKFEMEDHRNWMDASYKTYVCSLLDPWPYTLKKGEAFDQSITVTVAGKASRKASRSSAGGVIVSNGKARGRLPAIGVGIPMAEAKTALDRAELIAAAGPSHLVCQIDGRKEGQAEAAAAFAALKSRTGKPVTLEIVLPARESADTEVAAIAAAVAQGRLKPDAVVVTQMHDLKSFQPNTPRPWGPTYEEMAEACRRHFPGVSLGGGMLSYFTELNRKPAPRGVFDFVTHTGCPVGHAADDISVMETLESLPSSFASTRNMTGRTPYHLGPSGIPCRDNPYGAAVAGNPGNGRVCLSDMDPRQRGLFAATWSLGLAAAAARGGLDAIALGAATGPQGVIYRKTSYAQPWFDGGNAVVYPAYHVLAGLAAMSGAKRLDVASSNSSAVEAVAGQTRDGTTLWLANLTGGTQTARLQGFKGPAEIHMLDAASFTAAARAANHFGKPGKTVKSLGRIELGPYAVARIRWA
jgi:hypothetical protein